MAGKIIKKFIATIMAVVIGITSIWAVQGEKTKAKELDTLSLDNNIRKTAEKNSTGHIIFTKKQVDNRIKVIRDYYYNKTKKLIIRKRKIAGFYSSKNCNMQYYIHGKDLMFGYGTNLIGKRKVYIRYYDTIFCIEDL